MAALQAGALEIRLTEVGQVQVDILQLSALHYSLAEVGAT